MSRGVPASCVNTQSTPLIRAASDPLVPITMRISMRYQVFVESSIEARLSHQTVSCWLLYAHRRARVVSPKLSRTFQYTYCSESLGPQIIILWSPLPKCQLALPP